MIFDFTSDYCDLWVRLRFLHSDFLFSSFKFCNENDKIWFWFFKSICKAIGNLKSFQCDRFPKMAWNWSKYSKIFINSFARWEVIIEILSHTSARVEPHYKSFLYFKPVGEIQSHVKVCLLSNARGVARRVPALLYHAKPLKR